MNKIENENISKEIVNIAVLNSKVMGEDLIEPYISFVSTLISKKQYKTFRIEEICKDFQDEYAFSIPAMPMCEIINRMGKKNMLKQDGRGNIIPEYSKIEITDFNEIKEENLKKYENIKNKYIEFAKEKYKFEVTEEIAEKNLSEFMRENYIDTIINDKHIRKITETFNDNIAIGDKYILYKYILYLYENEYELFKTIKNICFGYTIANALNFDNIASKKKKFKDKNIYFDTKFILRLLGIEGEFYKESYEAIINALKDNNCKLYIFDHTYDEIITILKNAQINIKRNKEYEENVPETQKYFMKEKFTEGEINLYIATLENKLNKLKIYISSVGYVKETERYQIELNSLHQNIIEIYKRRNPNFDEESKKDTIEKDERSIELIYREMRGNRSRKLETAKYFFVTTNKSLAYACKNFDKTLGKQEAISPCITDIFLGTILWFQNPIRYNEIKEKQIVASCYAAVQPNATTINKFLKNVENLRENNQITLGDYALLKENIIVEDMLSDKIVGNIENITEDMTWELLEDIKQNIKKESEEEIKKKEAEIVIKDKKIQEIENDKRNIEEKNSRIEEKIREDANVKAITKTIISMILMIVIPIFFVIIDLCFDILENLNNPNRVFIYIGLAIFAILNIFKEFKTIPKKKEKEYKKVCEKYGIEL